MHPRGGLIPRATPSGRRWRWGPGSRIFVRTGGSPSIVPEGARHHSGDRGRLGEQGKCMHFPLSGGAPNPVGDRRRCGGKRRTAIFFETRKGNVQAFGTSMGRQNGRPARVTPCIATADRYAGPNASNDDGTRSRRSETMMGGSLRGLWILLQMLSDMTSNGWISGYLDLKTWKTPC